MVTFTTAPELAHRLKELSDEDLEGIGDAAHARISKEHLIRHRVLEMLNDLALE